MDTCFAMNRPCLTSGFSIWFLELSQGGWTAPRLSLWLIVLVDCRLSFNLLKCTVDDVIWGPDVVKSILGGPVKCNVVKLISLLLICEEITRTHSLIRNIWAHCFDRDHLSTLHWQRSERYHCNDLVCVWTLIEVLPRDWCLFIWINYYLNSRCMLQWRYWWFWLFTLFSCRKPSLRKICTHVHKTCFQCIRECIWFVKVVTDVYKSTCLEIFPRGYINKKI